MKYGIILFVISLLVSVILLNPKIKARTMALMLNTQKEVLSQLEMERDGIRYKVIKVHNIRGLALEIYKLENNETMLLDSHQLTDKKDAFYKFGKAKHNLFLKDINDDGITEIILPSLDKNMKARLNVFTFDSINEKLQKITQH